MTFRRELEELQAKARRAGRTANFFFNEDGDLDCVFYMDPKANGRSRVGFLIDPFTFAESEREKLDLWKQ